MENAAVPGETPKQRLERWVNDYSDAILRMCFVYLRDRQQAEDAMQDTFLKAWRHMAQMSDETGERAWLMRIAINTCHDYHRSRWFKHIDLRRELEDIAPAVDASEEDHALLMDVYALPEKYKQVLLLYYYQEMTLEETAQSLCISRSAAHRRLVRARELLRGHLTGRNLDE